MSHEIMLFFIILILLTLEAYFPKRNYKFFTPQTMEDGTWFFLNEFVFNFLFATVIYKLSLFFTSIVPNDLKFFWFSKNQTIQFFVAFIGYDFLSFLLHNLFHRIPFLWKIHSVHHSTIHLTSLSAFRMSWLERFVLGLGFAIFISFFNLSEPHLKLMNILYVTTCLIQHSNIRYPHIKALDLLFITPQNHRWHHAIADQHVHKNLGFVFSVWDRIFGSFFCPANAPSRYGLKDHSKLSTVWRRFFYPFYPFK